MSNLINKKPILTSSIITIALSILLLTSGCDILLPAAPLPATPTPTQTLTPTPTIDWFPATTTPTPVPIINTPTPQTTIADQREGITEILIDDNFSDESLWTTSQTESGNVVFGDENLTLAASRQNAYLFSRSQHVLGDSFYLEITLQTSLCQASDQFGILFWHRSQNDYYQILFNCSGQYRLELIQEGKNIIIHDWETAAQMHPSHPATNQVGIWVYQGQFQLYVNDTFQFEERIAQDRNGHLGVFARTIEGDAITIRFSELQVFKVDPE
jgi:hypothetical protein